MTRDFRWLLAGQTTSQFGAQVSGVAIPLLAVLSLGATPFELGLVSMAGTVGFALIGLPAGAWVDRCRRRPILVASDLLRAVLTPRLARRFGSERIIWGSLVVAGALGLLVPLAQPGGLVMLAVLGFAGGEFGQIVYAISGNTLRQRVVPTYLLGRVNATMRFLLMGLFPLGALLGGVTGSTLGPRTALWIPATLIATSWLPVYRALSLSRRTSPDV